MEINKDSTWEEITPGGTIYDAGNSREFKTGDWRSERPVFHPELANNVDYVFRFAQMMQYL